MISSYILHCTLIDVLTDSTLRTSITEQRESMPTRISSGRESSLHRLRDINERNERERGIHTSELAKCNEECEGLHS